MHDKKFDSISINTQGGLLLSDSCIPCYYVGEYCVYLHTIKKFVPGFEERYVEYQTSLREIKCKKLQHVIALGLN
ncbi:hypothetical protein BpHYR1_053640 [Brachionus plicatilis]|uniref:Uncharacterized protein n=1 Tax=Brachionus plicatilis TaxID=10195 RepID=A0A3M7QRC2_BRAPC|nr:hypothetical protein BpHYR1_053640 [Brachionus plicatilis]